MQAGIVGHGHGHQVVPRLLGFPRQLLGRDLHGLRLRKPELVSQKNFQLVLPALELQNSLDHLGLGELGLGHFHRQFVSFPLPLLGHLQNLLRALLLLAQEFKGMPHLPQFQIGHRRPGDNVALGILEHNLLCFRLLLCFFRLAPQRFVENLFRV